MPSIITRSAAILTLAAITTCSAAQVSIAAGGKAAAAAQSKNCVILYSPRYKRLRIKPIEISFRWCSKKDPSDCTNWKEDTIADQGKPFTIAAYCFTHRLPVIMDLRYNRQFGDTDNRASTKIEPHAMALKGDLAPHPFCGTEAAHRFEIERNGATMKTGKPRKAIAPKCVWSPIEKNDKPDT